MVYDNLKMVFDDHTQFNVDKNWAKEIINQQQRFITKNTIHSEFFGSGLYGYHAVRYTNSDSAVWADDILQIDSFEDLQDDVNEQDEIDPEYKHVSSNALNLSFIYVLHRLHVSDLPDALKHEAMLSCIVLNFCKHLTSGIAHRIKFNANISVSIALYESLDKKNDLKRLGSWIAMLRKRGENFIKGHLPIHDAWKTMLNNRDSVEYANEVSGTITKTLNRLTEKFHIIHKSQSRIDSSNKIKTVDGEEVIREYISKPKRLISDMGRISADVNDLIRPELLNGVVDVLINIDPENLREVLTFYSENFRGNRLYKDTLERLVIYMLQNYRRNKIDFNDIPGVIEHMRNMLRTSQVRNEDIIVLKESVTEVVNNALPSASDRVKISVRIGFLLYLSLRTISIKHFE